MDDLVTDFLIETAETLEAIDAKLVDFENHPEDRATLDDIFRLFHTIKGTCGFLGLLRLEAVAHASESLLSRFREGELEVTPEAVSLILRALDAIRRLLHLCRAIGGEPPGNDQALIDDLRAMSDLGAPAAAAFDPWDDDFEAVAAVDDAPAAEPPPSLAAPEPAPAAVQASPEITGPWPPADALPGSADDAPSGGERIRVSLDILDKLMMAVSELVLTRNQLLQLSRQREDSPFAAPLQRLSTITSELQDSVMTTRMQPIGVAWKSLPRLVRDVAAGLGKKIELFQEGETTELDRQVLELVKDPLMHMVRNAADHGLETPEQRLAAGKPATGSIRLSACHEAGAIVIRITDDGRGLNTAAIRRKAVDRGLVSQADAEAMAEAQVHRLIFAAGFSTAETITNLSGRGVGMDVVRANIEQIGGHVDVTSTPGQGVAFAVKIPLTLSIISALIVRVGDERFAIPQTSVIEIVRIGPKSGRRVETIESIQVLRLRERLLPLVTLREGLQAGAAGGDGEFVMVMQVGDRQFGVVVDAVLDIEEVVVKPLARLLRDIPVFSGATILGDGAVVLIIDPNGLANLAAQIPAGADKAGEETAISASTAPRIPLLLARAGSGPPIVVELSRIARLEQTPASQIHHSGERGSMQYNGRLMPVFALEGGAFAADPARQSLLILTSGVYSVALAVDEIIDAVEDHLSIELVAARRGVLGTAMVGGQTVEVLDVDWHLLRGLAEYGPSADQALGQKAVA